MENAQFVTELFAFNHFDSILFHDTELIELISTKTKFTSHSCTCWPLLKLFISHSKTAIYIGHIATIPLANAHFITYLYVRPLHDLTETKNDGRFRLVKNLIEPRPTYIHKTNKKESLLIFNARIGHAKPQL